MYHLRLCKGLSYSGVVSASKKAPDVFVEDKPTADLALATGYFALVEGNDKAPAPKVPTGTITALDTATGTQLKKYAEENGIDIKGLTRVDDIRAHIIEVEAIKAGSGTPGGGANTPNGNGVHDDDPTNQFVGGNEKLNPDEALDAMGDDELKVVAEKNGIDIDGLSERGEILARIKEAGPQ